MRGLIGLNAQTVENSKNDKKKESPQLLFLINLERLKNLNLPIYKIDKEWADKNRTILLKNKEGEKYEELKSILDYNEVIKK